MSLYAMRTRSCDYSQQIYVSSTGQRFFSSVPNGVFNLLSSSTELKDFVKLHSLIHPNKQCNAHCERHLCPDVHYSQPLFDVFTSIESLRWTLFVGNIDARGCELHLRDPYSRGNKTEYFSDRDSFIQACQAGELDIVKAMVERTQVDLEARSSSGMTLLHWAARNSHLPVVQYLCEQGANKEARTEYNTTPLHWAASRGHLAVVHYFQGLK